LHALRDRLTEGVRDTVDRVVEKSAAPDELSSVPTHTADRGGDEFEREAAIEANREQMLEAIDEALSRIDRGTYGRCEDCGNDIPDDRLELLPFASRCVECEEKRERG